MLNSKKSYLRGCLLYWLASLVAADSSRCGSLDSCKDEPTELICGFDEDKPCFRLLKNECERKYYSCKERLELKPSDNKFCKVDNFMCSHEYDAFLANWHREENILETLRQIYKT